MRYTPLAGLEVSRYEDVRQELFENFVKITGYTGDLNDFIGSNIHRLNAAWLWPFVNTLQEELVEAIQRYWAYLGSGKMRINGAEGGSYQGMKNAFSGLCKGLSVWDHSNNSDIAYGTARLYFDSLDTRDPNLIQDALRKSIPAGLLFVPTPMSPQEKLVYIADDKNIDVYCYNLTEDFYTPLEVHISYTLKSMGMPPTLANLQEKFLDGFNKINSINSNFYPDAYLCPEDFPGVAEWGITSKAAGEPSFTSGIRQITEGNKFVISLITVDGV